MRRPSSIFHGRGLGCLRASAPVVHPGGHHHELHGCGCGYHCTPCGIDACACGHAFRHHGGRHADDLHASLAASAESGPGHHGCGHIGCGHHGVLSHGHDGHHGHVGDRPCHGGHLDGHSLGGR